MEDLIGFIRAQLDEDERVAKKAGEAMGFDDPSFPDYRTYDGWELEAADAFIDHLSPARVLREVESKRAILDWHDAAWKNLNGHPDDLPGKGWLLAMVKVVKLLAVPFADRPGYQESWRP